MRCQVRSRSILIAAGSGRLEHRGAQRRTPHASAMPANPPPPRQPPRRERPRAAAAVPAAKWREIRPRLPPLCRPPRAAPRRPFRSRPDRSLRTATAPPSAIPGAAESDSGSRPACRSPPGWAWRDRPRSTAGSGGRAAEAPPVRPESMREDPPCRASGSSPRGTGRRLCRKPRAAELHSYHFARRRSRTCLAAAR